MHIPVPMWQDLTCPVIATSFARQASHVPESGCHSTRDWVREFCRRQFYDWDDVDVGGADAAAQLNAHQGGVGAPEICRTMVRFFWHVDEGCSAHVPVNGYANDGDVRCLTVEISAPGVAGSATAMLSLPPCLQDGTSPPVKSIGVVIAHDIDASSWQNRLMRSIAKSMAKQNYLVVRNYCNLKELRRLRMFDKALDTAVKCPYATDVQAWLLIGLGNGARVAATIAGKTKAPLAGVAVLSYPLNEPTPPAGKGAGFPTSHPQLVKLVAPLLAMHGAADTRCPPATMRTFLQNNISHEPGPRLVVVPGVDQSLESQDAATATASCLTVCKALLEFAHALAHGDAGAARLPSANAAVHSLPAAAADFAAAEDIEAVAAAADAAPHAAAARAAAAAAAPAAAAAAPPQPAATAAAEAVPPALHGAPAAAAASVPPLMQAPVPAEHAQHAQQHLGAAGTLPIAPIASLGLPQGLPQAPSSHEIAAALRYSSTATGVPASMHAAPAASQTLPAHASAGMPMHAAAAQGQPGFRFAVAAQPGMAPRPLGTLQPGFPHAMGGLPQGLPQALPAHVLGQALPHGLQPGFAQGMPQGMPHMLPMQGQLPPGLLQGFAPATQQAAAGHAHPTAAAAGVTPGHLPVAPLFMHGGPGATQHAQHAQQDEDMEDVERDVSS
eukprot:jgi/Ulvmu1/513/UM001_0521.1